MTQQATALAADPPQPLTYGRRGAHRHPSEPHAIMSAAASFRIEKDLLGTLEVPADAYYGIQTLRAVQNFRLSGVPLSHYPKLVIALAMVKQAAADANHQLGHLDGDKHAAISKACAQLI